MLALGLVSALFFPPRNTQFLTHHMQLAIRKFTINKSEFAHEMIS